MIEVKYLRKIITTEYEIEWLCKCGAELSCVLLENEMPKLLRCPYCKSEHEYTLIYARRRNNKIKEE